MLAPLRNPRLNFCILAALCTVFHCQAYPLGGDNLSIGGPSNTSHALGARFVLPSNPGEEEDDNDAPRLYLKIESFSDIDEEAGTAKLNGSDVSLSANPLELGENDAEGLSRKYYIIDPNRRPDALDKGAVLKIVDLLKAEKFGRHVVEDLRLEGWYWSQIKGRMLLWETQEPVEKKDSHGKVVKRDHMLIYRSTHSGVPLIDENDDRHYTKLKFIGEWVTDWDSKGKTDDMLAKCKDSAMKTHKRLAKKKMQINDYDLHKWVTDENCGYWLPNEINVAFDADEVSVKGGDELESGEQEAYLKNVKEQLDQQFTPEAIETHRKKLLEIPAQA